MTYISVCDDYVIKFLIFLTLLFELCLNAKLCMVPKIYIFPNITLKLKKNVKNITNWMNDRDIKNFTIKNLETEDVLSLKKKILTFVYLMVEWNLPFTFIMIIVCLQLM